jgi:CubicO group peptidase (beta-lactamase class C family)
MTKPYISTSILQLVDDDLLDLDELASNYIEIFRNTDKHMITIRQLLHHTAGFGSPGFTGFGSEFQNLEELINSISVTPLNAPPGTVYNYSTASVASLAHILSIVSGIRSDIYISRNIFNPLNMDHSFCIYDIDDYRNPIISSYYVCDLSPVGQYIDSWEPGNPLDYSVFTGSSGAFGSTTDYAKFLAAWSDALIGIDNTIISQESAISGVQPSQESINSMFPYGFLMFTYDPNDPNSIPYFGHTGVGGTSAGIYLYQIQVGQFVQTKKMVLLK